MFLCLGSWGNERDTWFLEVLWLVTFLLVQDDGFMRGDKIAGDGRGIVGRRCLGDGALEF